ncbi:divergent polysaccharide deacetylase family protein [Marinobacter oulmenensis]|uniref:Divergent polysaccharide deacetylase family protein n=1 Tax=Marinobacter oulmenensis TaxID=643747 RepID=A0A840U711_9GAMM|nr:divergent polysaccharide deacetylase family protein [Marinobacter oulmenensis]MBB5319983.1 hypothetical protein [Marinobacter oulmenensis]
MKLSKVLAWLLLAIAPLSAQADGPAESQQPTIAIIIDDMGYNVTEGRRLAQMDQPLTLSFLPFRRHTVQLAELAHDHRKEIMLHAPMANTRHIGLGAGGLTPDMDARALATTLRRSLQSIPHVQGMNNHMGSLLTQQLVPMDSIMQELNRYPVYFVDSRTIASSIAGEVAKVYRIPSMTRDVFLDHQQTEEFVDQQFKELIRIARKRGTAIGIGHPHKVTVDYLEKHLPMLDKEGIAVATVSGLWAIRNGNRQMFAKGEKQPVKPAYAHKLRSLTGAD